MKPLCGLCGTRHETWRGHVFVSQSVSRERVVVSHKEAPAKLANTYAHRDAEKRREYQRVLMQLRRAVVAGKACLWPRGGTPKEAR